MQKTTLYFGLLLLTVFQSWGQVQLGYGSATNKNVPFEPHSNYSYAQSIYPASEISATGTITAIKWQFSGSNSLVFSQGLTVYLGHTQKEAFASNADWEPVTNLTQVYTGGITANGAGWLTIELAIPFAYNGTDNLIVAVQESQYGQDNYNDSFFSYQVVGNRSLTYVSNSTIPIPQNPPSANGRKNYVPNVIFEGITQLCPTPIGLAVTSVTTTGASLSWQADVNPPSGGTQYYIATAEEVPNTATAPTGSVPTGNTATITGIEPFTAYYVWIRNVCEGTPGAWSLPVAFTTLCSPVAAFSDNFDETPEEALPACWSSILRGEGLSPSASVDVFYNSEWGTNVLQLYNNDSAPTSEIMAISPQLSNLPNGTQRLKFTAGSGYIATGIQIGTLNNNTATAVFTPFQQVIPLTADSAEDIVDFTTYTGTDTYIGMKLLATSDFALAYIDSIRWELKPACQDVTQITVASTTISSATVGWTAGASETQWEVTYGDSTVTDPSGLTVLTASGNATKVIPGLEPNASYNVWVRSLCGAGAGAWIGPVSFTTPCIAVNTLNENFETASIPSLPECWTSIITGDTVSEDTGVDSVTYNVHSGSNAVVLGNAYANTTEANIILVSPNLGNLYTGDHRLKFYAKVADGAASLEIGTLNTNQNSAVLNLVETKQLSNDVTEYTVNFNSYTGADTFIGIRLLTGTDYTSVYIDDIRWEAIPACADVHDIAVSGIETTSVTANWQAGGTESAWQLAYGGVDSIDPDTLTSYAVAGNPEKMISDLLPNTAYNLWIRSVCGQSAGNGVWIGPFQFQTACLPVVSVNEDFENAAVPALPGCWSSIIRGEDIASYAKVITSQFDAVSGMTAAQLTNATSGTNSDIILVSPNMLDLSSAGYRLKFYAHNYGGIGNLQLVALDGNNTNATYTVIQNVALSDTYTQYNIELGTISPNETYIGFRLGSEEQYATVLIDDVVLELAPACADVFDISVGETTADTASLIWSGDADGWQAVYSEFSDTDPETLTDNTTLLSSEIQLSQLQPNTVYYTWVRTVCGNGKGNWIGPVAFTTNCAFANVPYFEDFESAPAPDLPACTSMVTSGYSNDWQTVNHPGSGFENQTLVYGYVFDMDADSWYFTNGIYLTGGNEYFLSYKYGNNSTTLVEKLVVKFGTAADPEAMTSDLNSQTDITGSTAQSSTENFFAPSTGVYYFGFKASSAPNQGYLFLDDIAITTSLGTGSINESHFISYPNPVKDILNLSDNQTINNVAIYNLLGQKIMESTFSTNTAHMDMSKLTAGTYIVKANVGTSTKTIKVIKQ